MNTHNRRAPFKRRGHSGFSGGHTFKGNFRHKNRGRFTEQKINVSQFVNKAVVTEKVETYTPKHAFTDFPIDAKLKNNVAKKGYTLPTPIQDQSIPHILRGADLVGIANTGTGKTAAFLIPLINKVLQNRSEKILIVVPTRELAIQIDQEFKAFSQLLTIFSVCVVGGAPIGRQISSLRQVNNFVIGTPGRLKDLIEQGFIRLSEFKTVVLDEADRMLDMGFINDMRFMMDRMPKERQTLFFSATMSPEISKLINDFLKEPVRVSVKTQDTSKNVDQDVVRVSAGEKMKTLQELLSKEEFNKVLIFGRTKHGVERISNSLIQNGFKAESIHGDKNHSKRQRALGQFKNNQIQVLVATDVAARGLDIADVSHVINYDVPATYEDYIHRIGRTGRGNKKGKALTFVE